MMAIFGVLTMLEESHFINAPEELLICTQTP